ncbi:MAG: TadE/TadG family type IV pilus assembly protein [Pirellulales bacterium]
MLCKPISNSRYTRPRELTIPAAKRQSAGRSRPNSARGRRERRGAAAVELAVVSPLLVLILLGIVQFGCIFFTRQTMVHAAREGIRHIAVEGATEAEGTQVTQDYLDVFGINGAIITAQNAYKGNGNSAAARQVTLQVALPAENASILGDVLGLFSSESRITVDLSMRKEGELVAPPSS